MKIKTLLLTLSVLLALCCAMTTAVSAEDLFFSENPFAEAAEDEPTATPTPTQTPTPTPTPISVVYNFFRLDDGCDSCMPGYGPQPQPQPRPQGRPVYLPATGITGKVGPKPASVNYESTHYSIELPSINAAADLMIVPKVDGEYPVTWLGKNAGVLEGSALPGEGGQTWIVGHNHIDADEYGPFMDLGGLESGDRIFVMDHTDGSQMTYVIYENIKVAADDLDSVYAAADRYPNTMTLITCEDESSDGGYTNRRVVCARPM